MKKFTEIFAKPAPLLDLEGTINAPKFKEKNQFSIDQIRDSLTLSKLKQTQQTYKNKFDQLQKEHKKEFHSYLTKQFDLEGSKL